MSLRSLDDRWLPGAAARARRLTDGLTARATSVTARWRAAREAWDLGRLDDRWARGPLGRFRERPQVALLVVVAVLVAGVGVVAFGAAGHHSPSQAQPPSSSASPSDELSGTRLGPAFGANVTDYIRRSTAGLVTAYEGSPDAPRVALVSLTDYRTPEQVSALLKGYVVSRAFLRAKAAGAQATPLPVDVLGDLLVTLRKVYADTAQSRLKAQQSYQSYVDSLSGAAPENKKYRDLYGAFARAAGIEAQSYAHNCPCVYAVVVAATPAQLMTLRTRPGVRAVEVAGPGRTLRDVQVLPLQPDVYGVVPQPGMASH